MASPSRESQEHTEISGSAQVKITILASEWGSSKGGLSTINRELAIQLAKCSSVEITFFVPQCSDEDKEEALRHNVHILKATPLTGYGELEWLSFPPKDLEIHIIVGHGVKLGRQAQVIRNSHECKWVQVVHTDPEELGMFKSYPNPISAGEKKHCDEVELCNLADLVVGIGPKLTDAFRSYLSWCGREETIFDYTPGLFDEFMSVKQVPKGRKHPTVLVFGRGDTEDFELKGFDIAARAVASLPDTHFLFFGAPDGKLEEVAQRFLDCDVPANRLKVRSYNKSRESLKRLFCEVDLVLMPSRTEGFGLTGLEALSAGLPVLVCQNSGFGEALNKVPFGSSFVIDSEDCERWAAAIKKLWEKDGQSRLEEAEVLRSSYERKYSWSKQSDALLFKMISLVRARLGVKIDIEAIKGPDVQEKATGRGATTHERDSSVQGGAAASPNASNQPEDVRSQSGVGNESIPSGDELLRKIADKYIQFVNPSRPEEFNGFLQYMKEMRKLLIVDAQVGSLIITVEIRSLQILEDLWEDYRTGHLSKMAQKCLVPEDVLKEFGVSEVRLTTTIAEEEYRACRDFFERHENNESGDSLGKDQQNKTESAGGSAEVRPHSNLLLRPERDTWETVPPRGHHKTTRGGSLNNPNPAASRGGRIPSRGASNRPVPLRRQFREGDDRAHYDGARGRAQRGSGQRGRGLNTAPGRAQGKGAGRPDPVSLGFTYPHIKYEWAKLYVLGLHYRTSPDSVKNYIEIISGHEVSYMEWFKPNGKAIVTLKTDKISDFQAILRGARKRALDGVNVLIERAPECKSVYVSGFSDKTTQEKVQTYFDNEVGALDPVRGVVFSPRWDGHKEYKRAIVYFKDKRSIKKSLDRDHFIDGKALHVEAFYPFMGTVSPVDQFKGLKRLTSADLEGSRHPEFYKAVHPDLMAFIMKSNQEGKLRETLLEGENARIRWIDEDRYVLIKYGDNKVDKDLDVNDWKRRCSGIVDSYLDSCSTREFPVDDEIWEAVADQQPQIEGIVLPKFTAKVKLMKESRKLKLICQSSNMPDFEGKLASRLKDIKQEEREKKLERKTGTDISSENLQLLQNARIEDILKREFNQEVRAEVNLSNHSLVLKTPKGFMLGVQRYMKQRLDEIDQNAIPSFPEILDILKTKAGKRKLDAALPEGCAFNVDKKTLRIILLGRTPSETKLCKERAVSVLVSDKSLVLTDKDNSLIGSEKWNDLCKKLEKRLKIRLKRELQCMVVFGFKQDVTQAVNKMRDFLNEKKATEGEFTLDSPIHRTFFNEFYKDELKTLENELECYAVKISFNKGGNVIRFSGSEDGVKEVEERLYALQDSIKEKTFSISTPGMRNFLAQEEGDKLIAAVATEHRCIIKIADQTGDEGEDSGSDSDESPNSSNDGEEEMNENEETFFTTEGKKVIWKPGNIEEEQADILVCSVGLNFNLSIGAIANAMSKAAGPALQDALRKAVQEAPVELGEGSILHTNPGNLCCRHVIHCVCSPWKGKPEQEQILRELLRKCFDKASELGACSIGVPLIGTGNLYFPYLIAVQTMIEAAVDYSQANPESPLEEFRFVVFSGDQKGIETLGEKFGEFKKRNQLVQQRRKQRAPKRKPTLPIPEFSCKDIDIEGLAVKVLKGNITHESSDVICNVVSQDLDMQSGNLSRAIVVACGSSVQEELSSESPQQPGSIVITSAGLLPAIHIAHMVIASGNKQHLQTCVEKALKAVDSRGLRSVSIPAVGSGELGLTGEASAAVVYGAIRSFAAKPFKSVREVRIVILDNTVFGAFVAELEVIQTESDDPANCRDIDEVADTVYEQGAVETSTGGSVRSRRRQNLVVCGRTESLDAAMTALKEGVVRACKDPHVIKHDVLSRLSRRCMRDLKRKARARDVKLDQPDPDTIILEGLPKDVLDLGTEVSSTIQEQMEREHKEERAEQMFKIVRWCMVSTSGKDEPFDKVANNEIELAYQDKKPSLLFTHDNLKAEINFDAKEVTFVRNGKIKSVRRRDVLPLPVEWDPQPRDERGKEAICYPASLAQESPEFKKVQEKFLQSCYGKVTIKSIERIQNPSMYHSYILRKQIMEEKNGTHENEWYLFHGTKYNSVKAINVQGFNRSLCGQNGAAYGDGVYFAKDAWVSKRYSQPSPRGERCMYLGRVLVGKYAAGKQGMKTPPARDPSKPEMQFDSVVNKTDDPTIFVVFNDYHAYPEYLITFTESSPEEIKIFEG